MMLLGHLMLIPGPLVMLSSAPDLRKMLPSHLEVLTSPLTHLAALTSPPYALVVTASIPVLLMERASAYGLVRRLTSSPSFSVMLTAASSLLMTISNILVALSSPLVFLVTAPGLQMSLASPSGLQMMRHLLPASATRLNKIGPQASLVYARQLRWGQQHPLRPVQPCLTLLHQPPPLALGPHQPLFPR